MWQLPPEAGLVLSVLKGLDKGLAIFELGLAVATLLELLLQGCCEEILAPLPPVKSQKSRFRAGSACAHEIGNGC